MMGDYVLGVYGRDAEFVGYLVSLVSVKAFSR